MTVPIRGIQATLPAWQPPPLAIILDPSSSAEIKRGDIIAYACHLVRHLPASWNPQIYRLGGDLLPLGGNLLLSGAAWANYLGNQGMAWLQEHSQRLSLIGPLLEKFAAQQPCPLVIILGAGLLHDAEDWQGHRLFTPQYWVSFATPLLKVTDPGFTAPDELLRRLPSVPVHRILTGTGFAPLYWDNPQFHLERTATNNFQLSTTSLDAITLYGWLDQASQELMVNAQDAHGTDYSELLAVVTLANPKQRPAAQGTLSPAESQLITSLIKHGEFRSCPYCQHTHAANVRKCVANPDALLGEPLFPSLNNKGCVSLWREQEQWHFAASPLSPMDDYNLLWATDTGLQVLRYQQGNWLKVADMAATYLVLKDDHAIQVISQF